MDGGYRFTDSYYLAIIPCEAGIAYTSRDGYNRCSFVWELDILSGDFGPKSKYVGTYLYAPPDNENMLTGYDVYRIKDAYCIMMPGGWARSRLSLNYNRYLSNKVDFSLSLGVSFSPNYTWFRADNWEVPESDRDYLSKNEIREISPFPEGTQMYLSVAFRPITFYGQRRF